jgi:DNA-binding HxlR family transcriptional regulator
MNRDDVKSRQRNTELAPLLELVERRWNIPVIADLYRGSGAKFVTLVNRLGIGRGSLSATLNHLVDMDLVYRNPGYGHPMRPEYLLTERGLEVGGHCLKLAQAVGRADGAALAYRKWTLPLVASIGCSHRGQVRFRDLRHKLTAATPRAITLGLKGLLEHRWIGRSLIDDYPPAAGYHLLARGERVYGSLEELCREP